VSRIKNARHARYFFMELLRMSNQRFAPKLTSKKHVARLERERKQVALIRAISVTAITLVILLISYGILDQKFFRLRKSVAEVNGEKITLGYFQERMQFQRANLVSTLQQYQYFQQSFGMDTSQQQQQIMLQLQSGDLLGDQVLSQLIEETIIRQEAANRDITVSKDEVDERLQSTFDFFPNGTPVPTITPTEFTYPTLTSQQLKLYPPTQTETPFLTATPDTAATLENTPTSEPATPTTIAPATPTALPKLPTATPTQYTIDGYNEQYQTTLQNIKSYGISEATYRSIFENIIYREKLEAELTKDVSDSEEQVLARHILVDSDQEAAALYQLLKNGADFAQLAQEKSKDTGSAVKGGELDWSTKDTFVTEFGDAAFSLPVGEIGEPVKTDYGYHIIQVVAREVLPLSADKYEQKKQTTFSDWLTKISDDGKAAETIMTFPDVWQANIPDMPAAISSILQQ